MKWCDDCQHFEAVTETRKNPCTKGIKMKFRMGRNDYQGTSTGFHFPGCQHWTKRVEEAVSVDMSRVTKVNFSKPIPPGAGRG